MTMETETNLPVGEEADTAARDTVINHLTSNEAICFKSQQRGEADLSKQQKSDIALELYHKSKLSFLLRFGKYLDKAHLDFFTQFAQDNEESYEIDLLLKDLMVDASKRSGVKVKNRRFEALKEMIEGESYFSEIEMMKRNPLLYEQLVGQYLTENEKKERDRPLISEGATLVKVLMEGIERDNAELRMKEEKQNMEEVESDDSDNDSKKNDLKVRKGRESPEPTYSRWGEFEDDPAAKVVVKKTKVAEISPQEQQLLREEFVTSMYQRFLDGKDEDFDYDGVDNNDKYDNMEIKEHDDEDQYFDSEEPETVVIDQPPEQDESEDELDIFMSALNSNPKVAQLSKDMKNL